MLRRTLRGGSGVDWWSLLNLYATADYLDHSKWWPWHWFDPEGTSWSYNCCRTNINAETVVPDPSRKPRNISGDFPSDTSFCFSGCLASAQLSSPVDYSVWAEETVEKNEGNLFFILFGSRWCYVDLTDVWSRQVEHAFPTVFPFCCVCSLKIERRDRQEDGRMNEESNLLTGNGAEGRMKSGNKW